jgi:AcrR family transcriptional regulator
MLAAARELFSLKGYHNVTMHEIADTAEFAIGTLYKFFKNKEELYKSLNIEQSERFEEAIKNAIDAEDDEVEKLRSFVRTKGAVFQKDISFIRLYFAETRGASFNIKAGLVNEIRGRHDKTVKSIAAIIETGIKKKKFKKIAEPYHLAVAIDSICNAFLFNWLEFPDQHPYPEDPDIILNILFQGLIEP